MTMASPQQPSPPSNPFDGFDNYTALAQQPPSQPQLQQPGPQLVPPNQWSQQPTQPATAAVQHQQQQSTANYNSFANLNQPVAGNVAVPLSVPHGGLMQPPAPDMMAAMAMQRQQQQLVPMAPNVNVPSPWALHPAVGQQQQQFMPMAPNSNVQSPWVIQPAVGQQLVPMPANATVQSHWPVQGAVPPASGGQQVDPPNLLDGFGSLTQQLQGQQSEKQNVSLLPDESEDEGLALIDVELDDDINANKPLEERKKDGDFLEGETIRKSGNGNQSKNIPYSERDNSWDRNRNIAPPPPMTPGRRHAEYLAQNSVPTMCSPLPQPHLVHHSGYVLSRISFRTVLMRKWKQTFWIQYGPTQLLFFRTFADYEDWLNNPYHTIKAREFLVKLRVDFVSDLKKASVMGYQVTQVRRKAYNKNVLLHFKLERWMDYGPTIAAAFAAREEEMMNSPTHRRHEDVDEDGMHTSNDVSALRKIILGCMRNARDFALIASRDLASRDQRADLGDEAGGYRGRYDAEEQLRDSRIPSGSGNMGYHQAFSAESSGRRRNVVTGDSNHDESESSENRTETANAAKANEAPPIVDLLG